MIEALGITIVRRPKGSPRKNGKLNHKKISLVQLEQIWV